MGWASTEHPVLDENSTDLNLSNYNLRHKPTVNYWNLHKGIQMAQIDKNFSTSNSKFSRNHSGLPHGVGFPSTPSFSTLHTEQAYDPNKVRGNFCGLYGCIVDFCFNQMSARRGLEKHGEKAAVAILKEFTQLHNMGVFEGVHKSQLTPLQLKGALRLVTVVKEKRDGSLKGRTCADGRPQRAYISKEEASSPAVAIESLLTSLAIDALEDRDIATADVSGAFLHGDMDDFVVVRLSEEESRALISVDREYERFMILERGKVTMYLRLRKALYGTLKAAIIWYNTFTSVLKKSWFCFKQV